MRMMGRVLAVRSFYGILGYEKTLFLPKIPLKFEILSWNLIYCIRTSYILMWPKMEKNGLSCLGLCIEKCYGILGYMFFFMKTSSVNREAQNKHFSESCPGNHIWVCKYYVHIYRSLSTGIGEREIHWDQTTAFWGTTPCNEIDNILMYCSN